MASAWLKQHARGERMLAAAITNFFATQRRRVVAASGFRTKPAEVPRAPLASA